MIDETGKNLKHDEGQEVSLETKSTLVEFTHGSVKNVIEIGRRGEKMTQEAFQKLSFTLAHENPPTEFIIKVLRDGSDDIRCEAALRLMRREGPETKKALIDALGDSDSLTRRVAVHALQLRKGEDITEIMERVAKNNDEDHDVRVTAADSLDYRKKYPPYLE